MLRDRALDAARRMLPQPEQTHTPATPRTVTEIPDNESLTAMLQALGYEVEVQRFAGGEAVCLISRIAGDGRHTIEVELSPGTRRIWLVARIGVADLHQAVAPLLARLLSENVRIAPHFFGYRAGDRRLLLYASMENHDINPSRLEASLERLCQRIRDTRPAWAVLIRPNEGSNVVC